MKGTTVCRFHGGAGILAIKEANTGFNFWGFKTGRYSKLLPKKLGETYEKGLADPHLLELREEIALTDSRISELVENIGSGESTDNWMDLRDVWKDMVNATRNGDQEMQNKLFPIINRLIRQGSSEAVQWKEITRLQEHRRKLSESEQKRMQSAQQMVAVESVMILMSATIAALKESVLLYADGETSTRILEHAAKSYSKLVGNGFDDTRRIIDVQSEE